MINRKIEDTIRKSVSQVPVVTILGPRQAGKTTLVKKLFPDYTYVNLEDKAARELAENENAELQRIDGCGSDNSKTE